MTSDDVRKRLAGARLYLLLTRRSCRRPPLEVLGAAIDGGCGVVQIREPELADGALVAWAREVVRITKARGVPLIMNDRADIALLAGADGVHVGATDARPEDIRLAFGERLVIGLSTHGRAELAAASSRAVDYCGLGPVFDTATKGLAGHGLDLVRDAIPVARMPTFAIGGITTQNAASVRAAGAPQIAVSLAICSASDPESAARALV